MSVQKYVEFKKRAGAQQITEGVVYSPLVPDTQNDQACEAEIASMAHRFTASGFSKNVDIDHNNKACGSVVIESYLTKADGEFGPKGSWVVAMKHPDDVWARIESGELTGYSLYGTGDRVKSAVGVNELKNVVVKAVSVVKKAANKATFVAKSDADLAAVLRGMMQSVEEMGSQIEAMGARLAKSAGATAATTIHKDILAEHDARVELEIAKQSRKLLVKTAQLEGLWGGETLSGETRRESEARLCREISELEAELAALGKSRAGQSIRVGPARDLISKDWSSPRTVGEVAADTPAQAAEREAFARKQALERDLVVKYSLFHSLAYARDRAKQLQLSAEIDAIETELALLRPNLAAAANRIAKKEPTTLQKPDAAIRAEPVKKQDQLPDVFADLTNSMGLRSQRRVD